MRASDIMLKRVINIIDGTNLGEVIDYDVDFSSGKFISLILEQDNKRKLFKFSKGEHELVIPFTSITTIGDDVILVNYGKASDFVL